MPCFACTLSNQHALLLAFLQVGHIFSMLPKDDQRTFFTCCKQLHNARSICLQFNSLTICADQRTIITSSSKGSNPFLCFPCGAQLKKLVLVGGRETQLHDDDASLLLQLLQPTQTGARLRVMSVLRNLEEVHFKVRLVWWVTGTASLYQGDWRQKLSSKNYADSEDTPHINSGKEVTSNQGTMYPHHQEKQQKEVSEDQKGY